MLPKTVGSTWLYNYDGKLWPVVLCDDGTPPPAFMNSRPSGYVLPAILLGKLKYTWVAEGRLREFDPLKNYFEDQASFESDDIQDTDSTEDKAEKVRRNSFTQDAMLFESPAFWKNFIEERSRARKIEREVNQKRERSSQDDEVEMMGARKRLSTSSPTLSRSHNKRRSGKASLLTPGPTPLKGSGTPSNHNSMDDSDDNDLFVGQNKSQSDPFVSDDEHEDDGQQHEEVSDEDNDEAHQIRATDYRLERERAKNLQTITENPPDDDACTIFVGEGQTPFSIPRKGIMHCHFLLDRVRFTDDLRSHVDLKGQSDVKAKDFISVAEYLQKREFAPKLIDSGAYQLLEGVLFSEHKHRAAVNIAIVYLTASKIRFGTLQLLCVNKLKALHPFPPKTLLAVVTVMLKREVHDCEAESEMQRWMIDLISEQFWTLVECEGKSFKRIMSEAGELRQAVLEALAEVGRASLDID